MNRFSCFLCLLLLPACTLAAGNTSRGEAGATADSLSHLTIQAFRYAAAEKENPNLAMLCVRDLDDHGLSEVIDALLKKHLTKEQMAVADHFYSTPLSRKFIKSILEKSLIANGIKVFHPVTFSRSETARINAFFASKAGMSVQRLASPVNPEFVAAVRPVLRSLVDPCRTQPM